MTPVLPVVLDACVLVNFSLCDCLLRLAEVPRLYDPKWSEEIIQETTRTLETKFDWPHSLTVHFEVELRTHFSEAWVNDYETLIPRMKNDLKDRHVSAVAVRCGAPVILTFNLRHFKGDDLMPWGVQALHPQTFLCELFRDEREIVLAKLERQALERGRTLPQLLNRLGASVPDFTTLVSDAISISGC